MSPNTTRKSTVVFPDRQSLAEGVCQRLVEMVQEAIDRQGRCAVTLSGGTTPRAVYARLAEKPFRSQISWSKLHLFWGDERGVPPDHPESNYRMAKETMLSHVPIPEKNVHRVPAELPPREAAQQYEKELKAFFAQKPPAFDLILLGLGTDGHTASLFPYSRILAETGKWVAAGYASEKLGWRISLTLPIFNAAKQVYFVVSGKNKAEVIKKVFDLEKPDPALPASLVHPSSGGLSWLLDADAASLLEGWEEV